MKCTLLLAFLLALLSSVYAGDGCKPVSCVTSFKDKLGHERSFTRFWIYDDAGRLILDSVNEPDIPWASPVYTEHYSYNNDSVIGQGRYTGRMVIETNADNLPVSCNLPNGARYKALYRPDGKLEKVLIARGGLNEKGQPDVEYSAVDSIVYFQGNIISYQYSGIVNQKVNLTYLKDTLYKQDHNPTDKLLALIGRPDEVPGFLNVQVFSKELMNTEECSYTKTYSYQLDDKGRVVAIDKTYDNGLPGSSLSFTHYEFRYGCK